MKTYLLVDLANLYNRAKHVIPKKTHIDEKTGLVLHTVISSLGKCHRLFSPHHIVFMLEGKSWRKEIYPPYKMNRVAAKAKLTTKEIEEDKIIYEYFNNFIEFLNEKTNCTVLQNSILEADDLISGWINLHPTDKHIIVSTDGDFVQLLSDNVSIYNGITQTYTSTSGVYDENMNYLKDKKTMLPVETPDPEWALFEKCIRGDTSDNIFSAYPGVREKGTKNKTGLREAFSDRKTKGFCWNNLMLQKFMHHDGTEHRVLDDYNRNVTLCDLNAQPQVIKDVIKETVESVTQKTNTQVGIHFMKFCGKHDLVNLSNYAQFYGSMFSAQYEKQRDILND